MASPARPPTSPGRWIQDGAILTFASFLAAVGSYLFQALMRRHLPWSEFGYLNTTLSLITFAGIPLAAASQTVTHHLALIGAGGDKEKMAQFQAASLKLLRRLTWILFALCLLLIYPVATFLHFPRLSLVGVSLLSIPVNLWGALGVAWCAGLSRFRLLSLLLIFAVVVRIATGALIADFFPWAESGIMANLLSGVVLALVVALSPHHATAVQVRQLLLDRELLTYGAAAMAVCFGTFVFLQSDQILAQRYFPGDELGRYSGAGLLGRAIVWANLPLLTIYFTRRSGHSPGNQSPSWLLGVYLVLIFAGAGFLTLVKEPLLQLFLGVRDPSLVDLTGQFAVSMVPIGILQAVGYYYLAARRIYECMAFGVCGLVYLIVLSIWGLTPTLMLHGMGIAASLSLLFLGAFTLLYRIDLSTPPSSA